MKKTFKDLHREVSSIPSVVVAYKIAKIGKAVADANALLCAAYDSAPDGMLPPQISDARKILETTISEIYDG